MKLRARNGRLGRLQSRPGQGLVEFVLIAPLLLLLILGVVEFARAWNIRHVITDAAREGARTLAVDNGISVDSAQGVVESAMMSAGLNPDDATITLVQCEGALCTSPNAHMRHMSARVTIEYPYEPQLIAIFLGWIVADGVLNINTTFVMRNE